MKKAQEAQICLRNPNQGWFFALDLIAAADRDANLKQSITIKTSVDGKDEITAKHSQRLKPSDASDGASQGYAKLAPDNKQTNNRPKIRNGSQDHLKLFYLRESSQHLLKVQKSDLV